MSSTSARPEGSNYPDYLLGFDWTVASVHSYFDLDQNQQTERILQAMASPAVNAIGHLSSRYIGRRPGIEHGVTFVIDTHSHHTVEGVCMEYRVLNAQRGWVDKKMVANTWPKARFLEWSRSKRGA